MNTKKHNNSEKPDSYHSYNPRDYPVGVTDFISTFPPERRDEVLSAVVHLHLRGKAEQKWVSEQIKEMLELPDILYKYVPCNYLDYDGFPNSLRATQPIALNDVMEGNIRTVKESTMDREQWYKLLSQSLIEIFGDDALSSDELDRRMRLYGDPRISTVIREYLSQFIGVVSFSSDPLIPTMWAHYANNSGFVVGYSTEIMKELGVDLRRVLYLELAPVYYPTRDNIVRVEFVDGERRQRVIQAGEMNPGIPLLGTSVEFLELRKDWRELAQVLFVKGETWRSEKEVRLLVDLSNTNPVAIEDSNEWQISVLNVPTEAIKEVYVGFNTPRNKITRMEEVVGVGHGNWKLKYTDSHAYRMQVTTTIV